MLPGATTLSFYITLYELKKLIQFLELYSKFNSKFTPAFSSSVKFKVNRFGIPFVNRIKNFKVKGIDSNDSNKLIHVGTNNFIYKYLDFIQMKTFGLVKIIPKNKQGEVLKGSPKLYGPEFLEYASSKLK